MANFGTVAPEAAAKPARNTPNEARQTEYNAYVKQVYDASPAQTGFIEPGTGENTRQVSHRVTAAGKRLNLDIKVWTAGGKVWFEKAAPAAPKAPKAAKPAKA